MAKESQIEKMINLALEADGSGLDTMIVKDQVAVGDMVTVVSGEYQGKMGKVDNVADGQVTLLIDGAQVVLSASGVLPQSSANPNVAGNVLGESFTKTESMGGNMLDQFTEFILEIMFNDPGPKPENLAVVKAMILIADKFGKKSLLKKAISAELVSQFDIITANPDEAKSYAEDGIDTGAEFAADMLKSTVGKLLN